jgi:hypothetical protein
VLFLGEVDGKRLFQDMRNMGHSSVNAPHHQWFRQRRASSFYHKAINGKGASSTLDMSAVMAVADFPRVSM